MRHNDGRAIPTFITQATKQRISQFLEWFPDKIICYINDTVEGIYKLLKSNYTKPVNIGNQLSTP